jgi:hypothetical protein
VSDRISEGIHTVAISFYEFVIKPVIYPGEPPGYLTGSVKGFLARIDYLMKCRLTIEVRNRGSEAQIF